MDLNMKRIKYVIIITLSLFLSEITYSQTYFRKDTLKAELHFRKGYSKFEPDFKDNRLSLNKLTEFFAEINENPNSEILSIDIIGFSSPEGKYSCNKILSAKRAKSIRDFLHQIAVLQNSIIEIDSNSIDWNGLILLVEASNMPYRDKVLDILYNTPEWIIYDGKIKDGRIRQLGMLKGGRPYIYMYENFFDKLRRTNIVISYSTEILLEKDTLVTDTTSVRVIPVETEDYKETVVAIDSTDIMESIDSTDIVISKDSADVVMPQDSTESIVPIEPIESFEEEFKPLYLAAKTNILYDLALVPNFAVEVYLGKGWSIEGNWNYAWWTKDIKHFYWRIYGGELGLRKYFGKKAAEKPLTGHHLGIYFQGFTYDFELGGRGYLSNFSYGVGLGYGYSLPITKRINLDFSLGLGFIGGEYKVYDPDDGCYVWKETRQRRWIGPSKADISLVWLIGRGNYNKKRM